jgi:YD repeat-containing protein
MRCCVRVAVAMSLQRQPGWCAVGYLWNWCKRFVFRQSKPRPYQKPRRRQLAYEFLEYRFGPTPSVEMGLMAVGVSAANPFAQPVERPAIVASSSEASGPVHRHRLDQATEGLPLGVTRASQLQVAPPTASSPPKEATAVSAPPFGGGKDFVQPPFQDIPFDEDLLLLAPRPPRPPAPVAADLPVTPRIGGDGGGSGAPGAPTDHSTSGSTFAGEDSSSGLGQPTSGSGAGGLPPPAQLPPAPVAPAASAPAAGPSASGGLAGPSLGGRTASPLLGLPGGFGQLVPQSPVTPKGPGNPPPAGSPPSSSSLTVYVQDNLNGLILTPNASVNDFSTYNVQLDANVTESLTTTPTISWDLSHAPDASGASGTSSFHLSFSWASFTGTARTDSVKVTVTSGTTQVSQTISFLVSSTSSPAYVSLGTLTYPTLLPPDALSDAQTMGGLGPYYQVGLTDGELQTIHVLPSYNPNVPPLQLVYVSTAANPQPIYIAHYQLSPSVAVPGTISEQLTFNGSAGSTVTVQTNSSGTTLISGDTMELALQANATAVSTGRYPYSFQVVDANVTPHTTTYTGSADILNYKSNAFGAGWGLAGLARIYAETGGVILDLGDGQSLWFANGITAGTFVTPPGDFSTLTQNTTTNVYTRTLTDGTQINFTSTGYQSSVVDLNGNTTTYNYNGSNQLTSIADLNNQLVTLAYSNGNVTSVTDPANRTTSLAYDTSGRLTSIKDPDSALWSYTYDSSNDLTQLTNPLAYNTTFAYTPRK